MISKIVDKIPEENLKTGLEKFLRRALELGAMDAKVIPTDFIIVDERVRAKCSNPTCPSWGTNAHCPPHAPDLDTVRKIISRYQYAIFLINKFPPETFLDFKNRSYKKDRLKTHEIVSKIEAEAFYSGYYLATGLADGPCKMHLCPDLECSALNGKGCRHLVRARGSLEGWGMNAYRMAVRAGWDIYPMGFHTQTEDVPHAVAVGLVLIY